MKVLGIGESVIDKALSSDSKTPQKHVGGPSLIALILLSRLGIECTLLTTVGRDEEATMIQKTLKKEGVILLANIQKHTKINTYTINTLDGSRKKVRGDVSHPPIQQLDRDFIRQFDLIIIDRHEPKAFYEVLEKKKPSAKIIIDPSTEVSQFTLDMIQYAEYPIIPIEALCRFAGTNKLSVCLEKIHKVAQKTVIITAGELGSIIYDGQQVEVIPPVHVKAVDVQGAGDIYRGAFAYGIIKGWNIKKSVIYANKVAALHCTKPGNASAIPTQKDIEILGEKLARKNVTVPTMTQYFAQL
jgi:sulfofructose kinase